MDRENAIKLIVQIEFDNMSTENREVMINNVWGVDENDDIFSLLSEDLKHEILMYDFPQSDLSLSKYDILLKYSIELSYRDYTNCELQCAIENMTGQRYDISGQEGKKHKYICPCCHNYTLDFSGEYDICYMCGWEDDGSNEDSEFSPVNHMTLGEAKRIYILKSKK